MASRSQLRIRGLDAETVRKQGSRCVHEDSAVELAYDHVTGEIELVIHLGSRSSLEEGTKVRLKPDDAENLRDELDELVDLLD